MPDPLSGPAPAEWIITALVLGAVVVVGLWERAAPARPTAGAGVRRWSANFSLFAIGHVVPVALVPLASVLSAAVSRWSSWTWPALRADQPSSWLWLVAAVLLLDLVGYLQHRLLHAWSQGWRVHQVHHSDARFDAVLSFRFHPLEVLLMSAGRLVVAVLAGMPDIVLWIDALLVGLHNVWSHANAHLGPRTERALRGWLVTPDLHRFHHSVDIIESNRNYGIVLSVWDRLFGTYHAPARYQPERVGLSDSGVGDDPGLGDLLLMPSRRCPEDG